MADQCFLPKQSPLRQKCPRCRGPHAPATFTQHFVLKPCLGETIFSGAAPKTGGYIAFNEPNLDRLGTAHISAMVDVVAFFYSTSRTMRPMATTSLQVIFITRAHLWTTRPVYWM